MFIKYLYQFGLFPQYNFPGRVRGVRNAHESLRQEEYLYRYCTSCRYGGPVTALTQPAGCVASPTGHPSQPN